MVVPMQDSDKWHESPYVLTFFMPIITKNSQPTGVFRDRVADSVIEVSRVLCDRVQSLLATSGQGFVRMPKEPAC